MSPGTLFDEDALPDQLLEPVGDVDPPRPTIPDMELSADVRAVRMIMPAQGREELRVLGRLQIPPSMPLSRYMWK